MGRSCNQWLHELGATNTNREEVEGLRVTICNVFERLPTVPKLV